jgi:hypothetical protein
MFGLIGLIDSFANFKDVGVALDVEVDVSVSEGKTNSLTHIYTRTHVLAYIHPRPHLFSQFFLTTQTFSSMAIKKLYELLIIIALYRGQ